MFKFLSIAFCLIVASNQIASLDDYGSIVSTQTCDKCLKLNSGHYIPVVGLGTSRLGKTDQEVMDAVKASIEVGYRHIDTADFYLNEKAIGDALKELIAGNKVKREEIFITTKVWSNHHTKELALQSVKDSLKKLQLNYLDLVLIHWPMSFRSGGEYVPKSENNTILGSDTSKENFEMAYKGLEEAVNLGLVRSIGVSNFNVQQLEKLFKSAKITPAVNQVESNPNLVQQTMLDFCRSKGIYLEAYSPLRRGDAKLFEDATLKSIAQIYNRTVAQVALRWQVQRGVIVIPKTSKRTRMIENKDLFTFALTDAEIKKVTGLDKGDRIIKFEDAENLPEYPF